MNHKLAKLASLALVGGLLSPLVAGADPIVSVTSGGSPVTEISTGELGQPIAISIVGCIDPLTELPGYVGLFTGREDPVVVTGWQVAEAPANESGGIEADLSIPLDNGTGSFFSRFYCSSAPVTDVDSPEMLWVAPLMTMDIQSAQARRVRVSKDGIVNSGATTGSSDLQVTVDPNSLPAVDRMGIPGAQAAKLKVRVDSASSALVKVNLFIDWLFRRNPPATRASTNTEYVTAAFATLTGKVPAARVMAPYVARLDAGQVRVQIVEEIALTAHSASWWIRKA